MTDLNERAEHLLSDLAVEENEMRRQAIVLKYFMAIVAEDRRRDVTCNAGHVSPANLWDCPHSDHHRSVARS